MTFEEEFPSLKYIHVCREGFHKENQNYIPLIDVRKHCIDKQKVKDAINNNLIHNGCNEIFGCRKCDLLKELGLDEK